jgi:hypothetical protein
MMMRMMAKLQGGKVSLGRVPTTQEIMENDKATIKVFQHELKMLVAPEEDMYYPLKTNGLLPTTFEVLPDFRPIFLCLDCGTSKLAAAFEILLGDCPDLTVLMSHTHKFPTKEKR